MKTTILKTFGVGLAVVALFATVANAQTDPQYNWVAFSGSATGSLTWNGTSVSDFSFLTSAGEDETIFNGPTVNILPDGDLQLIGTSTRSAGNGTFTWSVGPSGSGPGPEENEAIDNSSFYGDWVPVIVPEPATIGLVAIGLLGALAIRRRKA